VAQRNAKQVDKLTCPAWQQRTQEREWRQGRRVDVSGVEAPFQLIEIPLQNARENRILVHLFVDHEHDSAD
jgi:hypothetical protein